MVQEPESGKSFQSAEMVEFLQDNDFPTEKRANNIKFMKRELGRAKRQSVRKVKIIKEVARLLD